MKRKSPIRHVVKAKGKSFVRGRGASGKVGAGKEYVQRLQQKSSFIDSMTHSGNTLVVKMKDGKQYLSTGVDAGTMKKIHQHVKRTGSMGKAFHKYIRGQYPGKKL